MWPLLYLYFSCCIIKGDKHADEMKFIYALVFHVRAKAFKADLDLLFALACRAGFATSPGPDTHTTQIHH